MIIGGNPNLKIDMLYAFIAQDVDGEGVMAAQTTINGMSVMMPLIGADLARIKSLLPIVQEISQKTGKSFKLYSFNNKVEMEIDRL